MNAILPLVKGGGGWPYQEEIFNNLSCVAGKPFRFIQRRMAKVINPMTIQ
jgi:hypothetical protein